MSRRVLITDHPWPDLDLERGILEPAGAEIVDAPDDDEATLIELARGVAAIGTCWGQVTSAVIAAAAPSCRLIARFGIGLDNIDLDAAAGHGMMVTNVPDYCIEEVADHAVALILACARNVGFFHLRTKRREYELASAPPMRRTSGLTVGLLGLGRIGRRTAEKAAGLGLRVRAHTRSGDAMGTGVEMVDFDQLLETSDFVCLHAPLTDETRTIIDVRALSRMKPTAFLINTSRGGLVDETALWNAIRHGRLAGAALDVFDPEPPDLSSPLFEDERVIVTPHAAFVSEEAVAELRTRAAKQISAVLSGARPENVINR